jgi:hypothetical protein
VKCSNCGKNIPFMGNVCPWCHADKSKDQAVQVSLVAGTIFGVLIGVVVNDVGVGIVAGLVCGVGAAIACKVSQARNETKKGKSSKSHEQQPTGPIDPSTLKLVRSADASPGPPVAKAAVEERLKQLDALRAKNLVTEQEYQVKREKLLDEI